jgi:hypothetical protein
LGSLGEKILVVFDSRNAEMLFWWYRGDMEYKSSVGDDMIKLMEGECYPKRKSGLSKH